MTTKSRFTTAIATGAVLLNALAPIAFASDVDVLGNGAYSNNTVNLSHNSTTAVNQTNVANVTNNVSSNSSTGGNKANFNTGGDTTVNTGNATNNVAVNNALNVNKATVDNCGACNGGDVNVTIKDNGAFSDNAANVSNGSLVELAQTNVANVVNNVDADAKTGGNKANYNTGGDTSINTGNATTNVSVNTAANANIAKVGGSEGAAHGSSVTISGNGAFSDNGVNLTNGSAVVLAQTNVADIVNDVDADAKTGDNKAKFNTGGEVTIDTGNATTDVSVANLVNFNSADVDCGCVLGDLDLKVANNGAYSDNFVNAGDGSLLLVEAANVAGLANDVDGDAKTGKNDAKFNGSGSDEDPAVNTGDANSTTDVSNTGNVNVYGSPLSLPGLDFDFDFDLLGLWSFLHSWTV